MRRILNIKNNDNSRLAWAGIAFAVIVAALRMPGQRDQYVTLLAEHFFNPRMMSGSPILSILLNAHYTRGPKWAAHAIGLMASATSIPIWIWVWTVLILTWVLQGFWMFRWVRTLTKSPYAAFLAVVFFGIEVPIFLTDTATSLQFMERSLGMVPLLWGMSCLAEGKYWRAWIGAGLAVYAHPSPAMYFWPVLFLEDAKLFYTRPQKRMEVVSRVVLMAVLALPLVLGVSRSRLDPGAEALVHLGANIASISTVGEWVLADRIFIFESLVFLVLLAWEGWKLQHRSLFIFMAAVCGVFIAISRIMYYGWIFPPDGLLWNTFAHMGLWLSLWLVDMPALVLFSFWLARLIDEEKAGWPFLLLCFALSFSHDLIVHSLLLLTAIGIMMRRSQATRVLMGLAILPAAMFAIAPNLVHDVVAKAGLRGGFLSSVAFNPFFALAALLCFAWEYKSVQKNARVWKHAFAFVILVSAAGANAIAHFRDYEKYGDTKRMAYWISSNLPEDASILPTPINLVDITYFTPRAQRELFACASFADWAFLYGQEGVPMVDRLTATGIDLSRVHDDRSYLREIARADQAITPEQIVSIAKTHHVSYLLSASDRPWPWKPLRVEGSMALYEIPIRKM